ncbi:MAG: alpha/beta-type small acid-soluble spore protein [Clostridia bacterium]|nr:alpha/beta-type small acid-soluble spore protein [Clostridia bacterium]
MSELDEKLKFEVISELGLIEKVKNYGWKSLSAKETGRIGGLITKKKKMLQAEKSQQV